MHRNRYWVLIVPTTIIGLGGIQAAPRYPACAEIRAACKQAGFVRGHAKTGEGIFLDCIAPIMGGTPQPRRASRPLPTISPQLVADCKTQNPSFGQKRRNAPPPPPAEAPVPKT